MSEAKLVQRNSYTELEPREALSKEPNPNCNDILKCNDFGKTLITSNHNKLILQGTTLIPKNNDLDTERRNYYDHITSEIRKKYLDFEKLNTPVSHINHNHILNYNFRYPHHEIYQIEHESNIYNQYKEIQYENLPNYNVYTGHHQFFSQLNVPFNQYLPQFDTTLYKSLEEIERERQIKSLSLISNRRLYDKDGPVKFDFPPIGHIKTNIAEIFPWPYESTRVLSINSSKRRIHKACWISKSCNGLVIPAAVKFVEDRNPRDGRSIRREIECHLYLYQRISQLAALQKHFMPSAKIQDAWPCSEMLGYYLDKKIPGDSVLITRKLSGPDFFDLIRAESENSAIWKTNLQYQLNKLEWCILALERIALYGKIGIRHNDIKPDNIVLDIYENEHGEQCTDVKVIDLGTASMSFAKDFTGGTSWYESPEQKMREFYTKKKRDSERGRYINIDISSDAWGAGLSIAEVLSGRRAVDAMKPPNGPGQLEFLGPPDDKIENDSDIISKPTNWSPSNETEISDTQLHYFMEDGISNFIHDKEPCTEMCSKSWSMCPGKWVELVKKSIGLSNDLNKHRFPICAKAAVIILDSLVKPNPKSRHKVSDVAIILRSLLGKL